jgi:DNA mismatch repair protein MutS2
MASRFAHGDTVQTRLGKGVVREVRNGGRVLVDVQGRALVVSENEISTISPRKPSKAARHSEPRSHARAPKRGARMLSADVDLHGLTVDEALERVQQALNEALLADLGELRFIHGRSGGRIRAALHRHLRETPGVRNFRVDPRNEGVTIVSL